MIAGRSAPFRAISKPEKNQRSRPNTRVFLRSTSSAPDGLAKSISYSGAYGPLSIPAGKISVVQSHETFSAMVGGHDRRSRKGVGRGLTILCVLCDPSDYGPAPDG